MTICICFLTKRRVQPRLLLEPDSARSAEQQSRGYCLGSVFPLTSQWFTLHILTLGLLNTPCWTKQAAKAASSLHCINGNTNSRLRGVTMSLYSTLTRPHLQYCTHFGAQNKKKYGQTAVHSDSHRARVLALWKAAQEQPFQPEKRWLSADLTAVFPHLWLSRKHSQGLYSSACQSWKAIDINQSKRGPKLMQGKGFSWYRWKLK